LRLSVAHVIRLSVYLSHFTQIFQKFINGIILAKYSGKDFLKGRCYMGNISFYLKTSKNKVFYYFVQIRFAILAYIIAGAFDYTLTSYGLTNTDVGEGNPIAQCYIDIFGPQIGLLMFKLFMISFVILGTILISHKYGFKIAKFILYGGAIITLLGGGLWLIYF
jgi:hypothetical protein